MSSEKASHVRLFMFLMSSSSLSTKTRKNFSHLSVTSCAKLMSQGDIYFHFQHAFGIPGEKSKREGEKLFIVSTVWSANKLIKWFSK